MLGGIVNRQSAGEADSPRNLNETQNPGPKTADFCTVCGHWTVRPVNGQCKSCNERARDLEKK
jgi:hypothetical protein